MRDIGWGPLLFSPNNGAIAPRPQTRNYSLALSPCGPRATLSPVRARPGAKASPWRTSVRRMMTRFPSFQISTKSSLRLPQNRLDHCCARSNHQLLQAPGSMVSPSPHPLCRHRHCCARRQQHNVRVLRPFFNSHLAYSVRISVCH